jgi:N-acetylglutamate synthase-like GNAT family acetyltransferase
MITGVHHIHPDKPPQMWINELGVAPPCRRRGIARALLSALLDHARGLGCTEAWAVADPTPEAEGFWRTTGAARTGDRLAMFTFPL